MFNERGTIGSIEEVDRKVSQPPPPRTNRYKPAGRPRLPWYSRIAALWLPNDIGRVIHADVSSSLIVNPTGTTGFRSANRVLS